MGVRCPPSAPTLQAGYKYGVCESRSVRYAPLVIALSGIAFGVAFTAILGHLSGNVALYRWGAAPMALNSALGMFANSCAILIIALQSFRKR